MVTTLDVIVDIYSKPDKNGKQKIIKKNVIYKKQFECIGLLAEHCLDSKGNILNKYCLVKEGDTYFKLNHKFSDIEKLTSPIKVKGFYDYSSKI